MLENAMRVFQCVSVVSLILSLSLFVCGCVCVLHKKNSPLCLSWQGALYRRLRVATWVFRIRFGKRFFFICIRIAYSYVQTHSYSYLIRLD